VKPRGILASERIDHWKELTAALEEAIPFYEHVNTLISLGRAQRWRVRGLKGISTKGGILLDAGIGPGNMSAAAIEILAPQAVVGLDPSPKMLRETKETGKRLRGADLHLVRGIFETLPFRAGVFSAVVCGFSLRDALDLEGALSEFRRALSRRGKLLIIDIGKPDNPLARFIYKRYLRIIVPLLARVATRWMTKGNPWNWLALTYEDLPQNNRIEGIITHSFGKVDRRGSHFGFVNRIIAERAE
jgi:demethylmenaquinone methyltransferase/2-methoxy-6-polyprenyl-1,4-benzoquinol methylase